MKLIDSLMKFCTVKAAPTVIITTAQLVNANASSPFVLHDDLLSQVGTFEILRPGYNWGGVDVPLTMYMHTIARAPSLVPR
jgi:hypothetical protein